MTTHGDAAARVALMHEYVKYRPEMEPSIYRLAGVAHARRRVDGNGRPGTTLSGAHPCHLRHVEGHERRPEGVDSLTHKDSTDGCDLSVRARLGLPA